MVAQAAEERRLGRLGPKTLGARLRKVEEQVYKTCDTDHGELLVLTTAVHLLTTLAPPV